MVQRRFRLFIAALVFMVPVLSVLPQTLSVPAVPEPVQKLIKANCLECHGGRSPSGHMNLEPEKIQAILNRLSRGNSAFKLIDTDNPDKSYLLIKLRGATGIEGSRMPLMRKALKDAEIQTIADWIRSLAEKGTMAAVAADPPVPEGGYEKPPFWGLTLANLPTTTGIEPGHFLFRIAHRFLPSVKTGIKTVFGFDGPSSILIGFGYGLSERLSATFGLTNQNNEIDLAAHYRIMEQSETSLFGLSIHAGGSLAAASLPDRTMFDAKNVKVHVEASFSRQISERISLLVVPAYVSNANHWEMDRDGTFSVGFGGRWMVLDDISIIAEWVPVLAGYKAAASGWAFGLEKKIGGHVFQFFALDSAGATPSQFLPGGDLLIRNGDFRFGFNIYRLF